MYKQPQIHGLKSNTIFMIKKYSKIDILFKIVSVFNRIRNTTYNME